MNNYTIAMKVNNNQVTLNNYAHFGTMLEVAFEYIEDAYKNHHPIDDVVLCYKDAIIATDIPNLVRIGSSIAGFDVMFTDPTTGYCVQSMPLSVLLTSPETIHLPGKTINVNIVGKRQQMYDVLLPNSMLVSNLNKMFTVWAEVANDAQCVISNVYDLPDIEAVLEPVQEPVDTEWMLGYYVRNELKQIKELLETDLQEAKKRISVMEYMINSKVKI